MEEGRTGLMVSRAIHRPGAPLWRWQHLERAREMGRAGRKSVGKFSLEQTISAYEDLYWEFIVGDSLRPIERQRQGENVDETEFRRKLRSLLEENRDRILLRIALSPDIANPIELTEPYPLPRRGAGEGMPRHQHQGWCYFYCRIHSNCFCTSA